jgi:hypothetical protein
VVGWRLQGRGMDSRHSVSCGESSSSSVRTRTYKATCSATSVVVADGCRAAGCKGHMFSAAVEQASCAGIGMRAAMTQTVAY